MSPYTYTADNPVMLTDPEGLGINPIVDYDGNILGASHDSGMEGDIIVMDKDKYKEGLSDKEALNLGKKLKNMDWSPDVVNNIRKKVNNTRPDRDGIVTVEEANDWYKKGSGKPLYVDISKMKFKSSPVSVKDLKEGEMQQINFFNMGDIHPFDSSIKWRPASDYTLSRVYGTLRVVLKNPNTGEIDLQRGFGHKFAFDRYDFNGIDGKIQGGGKGFDFYGYNTGHVRVEPNKRPDNEKSINFNSPIHYDIKN